MPAATPGLALLASTGVAGFALQDATPTILSWTAPNDGNLHRIVVMANADITSAETGGAVGLSGLISPNGASHSPGLFGGGSSTSLVQVCNSYFVEAGSTVTLAQTSALTAGAAILWAEIWGY